MTEYLTQMLTEVIAFLIAAVIVHHVYRYLFGECPWCSRPYYEEDE